MQLFKGRGRVSARQPRYFLLLRQKISTQRKGDPIACVPALRSGQTCVTQFRLWCRPTRCAARRFAQTNGGKSEHKATLSCGSVAHSLNRVPQAQTDGRKRERTTCMGRVEFALTTIKSERSYPAPGIAPCAHACDGKFLGLAVAPQSATASSSLLRQRV